MKADTDLASYLQRVTGSPPVLIPIPGREVAALPLYLRSTYQLVRATLFGHTFVLAQARDANDLTTPSQYAKHAAVLRAAVGHEVAFVVPGVESYTRTRLIGQGIPFIVPGRQMFLPFLAVDLRERGPRRASVGTGAVTMPAQLIVLAHLLGRPVEGRPLAGIAVQFGYSTMTLTKVADELQARSWCEDRREGRTRQLSFAVGGMTLWAKALPDLRSPVRERHWVRAWTTGDRPGVAAGLTAMERFTAITDDQVPTYAVGRAQFRAGVKDGDVVLAGGPDEAQAVIEVWGYDPTLLAEAGCVDRLSLYLSLRDSPDERVQKELGKLLGGVGW